MFRKIITSLTIVLVSFCIIMIGMLFSLDVSKTEVKQPADIIVSLGGGIGSRVEKAWDLQTKGYAIADKLIVTGIPMNPETVIHIHPRLKYLNEHKDIRYEAVSILETNNTWEEALYIKSMMQKHDYKNVIIVTHPLHSGRVKMSLERVAHFREAGLEYTIVSDRKIHLWKSFLNDKKFRDFALLEIIKRLGYEVKAVGYNITLRIEKKQ